jgi:hypothetical protein
VKKPGIRNWGREGKKRKAPRGSAVWEQVQMQQQ